MKNLTLNLPNRKPLEVVYKKNVTPQESLHDIDALIIETNYGFNDLGLHANHIENLMGIDEDTLRSYADSLMNELLPTVDILPTQDKFSTLKAIALVSSPNCRSYKPFESKGARPNKDFFYNIAYESLAALSKMGLKRIGIAGLTGSLRFIDDHQYKNAIAEAVCHAAHDFPDLATIQIVSFGPIISYGIEYFNKFTEQAKLHKNIPKSEKEWHEIRRITLDIPRRF